MILATQPSLLHPVRLPPALCIAPLPEAFLARARAGTDDLDQPVERHIAQGGEPLRDCLRRAEPGESILLASFCPFSVSGPFKEYGPVFLAADPQPLPSLNALPIEGDRPYLGASFVLRAYSKDERIVDARLSSPGSAVKDLQELWTHVDTEFVLARFTTYGCYALRISRGTQG